MMRRYRQTNAFQLEEDLTSKNIDRYFRCKRYPTAFWAVLVLALLLITVSAIAGLGWLFFAGMALFVLNWMTYFLRAKTIPIDTQYDEWLNELEGYLGRHSRDKFRREHSKTVPKSKCVRSFAFPDSDLSSRYSVEKLLYREGKDHELRFSFVIFTFFYPADRYVAVYTYRVNVLNQYEVVPETDEAYAYAHIAKFKKSTSIASAHFNDRVYSYRLKW